MDSQLNAIAELKKKMYRLEKENIQIQNENNDLRAFSVDGITIAKSLKSLKREKEKALDQIDQYEMQIEQWKLRNAQLLEEVKDAEEMRPKLLQ